MEEKGRLRGGVGPGKCTSQPISGLPSQWIRLQAPDHRILQAPSYSSQSSIHWRRHTSSAGHRFRSAAGRVAASWAHQGRLPEGFVWLGQGRMGVLVALWGVLSFLGVAPGGSPALHLRSTSCHLARPIASISLGSLSFLGKDVQGLALFHARWDGHGRLQVCIRQDEPELTAAFGALCAGEITRGSFIHTLGPELQRALAILQSQWEVCQGPAESPAGTRQKRAAGRSAAPGIGLQRVKRGWTMPGTLWCGVGDSARNSTELGETSGCGLGGWWERKCRL